MKKFQKNNNFSNKFNFLDLLITKLKKMDESCNIFISKIVHYIPMTESAWKCFRCNLTFKDEVHAKMHSEISRHSTSKVKILVA
ncbi:MAG: hypothetical protein DWQ18_02090 [Crenarchaeota archaeon]|nr:MAG: hypothetical protein DWQ17_06440 [Thermoproteota archaeon]RDJ33734.1 MAG: hypothetical protein DWQ18_02090 [Thermoproteota archaeon]RDJ37153.1 MAG: hypothetical protein DWQ13_08530 [Thermoproteota archaeon]RDJ37314.1 MAG: hypothetical protein DWQ19_02300 [Thermoproteota archaeon]